MTQTTTKQASRRAADPDAPAEINYTVPEAAAKLRCSAVTVRNWIAEGRMVAIRPGRRFLVPKREVDRLMRPVQAPE